MATVSKGRCYLCGKELGKTAMKNHILKAHGVEEGGQECQLLKIEGADKNYWLYVDMPVTSSLTSLDSFLRKIWLECCGHLSEFSDGRYHSIGKGQKIGRFQTGDRMLHQYDFGDTTETLFPHLREIDRTANERLDRMIPALARAAGATEELKARDPLKWTGLMNTCRTQAEEVILSELIDQRKWISAGQGEYNRADMDDIIFSK